MPPEKYTDALKRISFKAAPESTKVINLSLKNPFSETTELSLKIVGSRDSFRLPKDHQKVTLPPRSRVTIPVVFSPEKSFRIMAAQVPYITHVQVWDRKRKKLIHTYPLKAEGPGYVPAGKTRCYHHPDGSSSPPSPHNSPPSVFLTVYKPGTTRWANMDEVDYYHRVSGLESDGDILELSWSYTVPATGGGFPEGHGDGVVYTYPDGTDHFERTSTFDIDRSYRVDVRARNSEGSDHDWEWLYGKIGTGFRHACLPQDYQTPESEITTIRHFLEDIEAWLLTDDLGRLDDYVTYFNNHIMSDPAAASCRDHSFHDGGCRFVIDDFDYLTAPSGSGGLTDDMLGALRHNPLLMYTKTSTMPRGFRNDEHRIPREILCDRSVGLTSGADTRVAGEYADFTAICRELGADSLTLIHELFHYSARQNWWSEDRAFAVSYLYGDVDFWGEW